MQSQAQQTVRKSALPLPPSAFRLLAIETTTFAGSTALFDGERLVAELPLPAKERSARTLAPTIEGLLREAGWMPADLTLVAVVQGPGSFTGLRVGITTARLLAYAAGAELIGIDTHEAIAHRACPTLDAVSHVASLQVVLDAQREELFVAVFRRDASAGWMRDGETRIVPLAEWLGELSATDAVCGPALEKWHASLPTHVHVVDRALWSPTASAAGELALRDHQAGRRDDLWKLAPRYLRLSYAEEKTAKIK